jgi:hypothetical protein
MPAITTLDRDAAVVCLDDGTLWHIAAEDLGTLAAWSPGHRVAITHAAAAEVLENKDHGTRVRARAEIQVQVNAQLVGAVTPQSGTRDFVPLTPERVERLRACIRTLGDALHATVGAMTTRPSEYEVEFGISLGAEAGLPFITKGTAATNFKVKVKWATEKKGDPPVEAAQGSAQQVSPPGERNTPAAGAPPVEGK